MNWWIVMKQKYHSESVILLHLLRLLQPKYPQGTELTELKLKTKQKQTKNELFHFHFYWVLTSLIFFFYCCIIQLLGKDNNVYFILCVHFFFLFICFYNTCTCCLLLFLLRFFLLLFYQTENTNSVAAAQTIWIRNINYIFFSSLISFCISISFVHIWIQMDDDYSWNYLHSDRNEANTFSFFFLYQISK